MAQSRNLLTIHGMCAGLASPRAGHKKGKAQSHPRRGGPGPTAPSIYSSKVRSVKVVRVTCILYCSLQSDHYSLSGTLRLSSNFVKSLFLTSWMTILPSLRVGKRMRLYMNRYGSRKVIAISEQEGWGQTAVRKLGESNNRSTANER